MVIISTRHNQHAPLTIKAFQTGKAVFVEKPLAISEDSLADVCETIQSAEMQQRIMVGFNRRFSPLAIRCKEFFDPCNEPLFVEYRVNAGSFPPDSWVYDPVEGGGRIIGEVCHFIDMICFITGALPIRIFAEELVTNGNKILNRDNVTITLRMSNDSVGVIHYMANGDVSVPKEYMEIFGGQRTAILDNYRRLTLHSGNKRRSHRLLNQSKGHSEEAASFISCLRNGSPMPINFESLVATTQTTFLIHRSLDTGAPVDYTGPGKEVTESEKSSNPS